MKIGVMSDTHGSLTYFEKALDVLSDCDVLIHGGDILYHGPRNDIPCLLYTSPSPRDTR